MSSLVLYFKILQDIIAKIGKLTLLIANTNFTITTINITGHKSTSTFNVGGRLHFIPRSMF